MHTSEAVLAHAGINNVLNNKSQWNTDNFSVILNNGLQSQEYIVLTTIKNLVFFVLYVLIYIDNWNIRGVHPYQVLQSGKKVLLNIFISCLNRTFLMHQQHPLQTWTQIRPQKMRGIEILEELSEADSSTKYLDISSCDLSK